MTEQFGYPTLVPLFTELCGTRVLVRPFRVEDAEPLHAAIAASRDHIRPWLPFADAHQSIEETRDWVMRSMARCLLRESINCGVWHQASAEILGGLGVHPHDWSIGAFEIGYWLRASAEGQGYISEAVGLVVDYLLGSLHANRVEIRCDARNVRSASVARRLGFVQEAHLRNDQRATDGTLRHTLVFARTPDDPR